LVSIYCLLFSDTYFLSNLKKENLLTILQHQNNNTFRTNSNFQELEIITEEYLSKIINQKTISTSKELAIKLRSIAQIYDRQQKLLWAGFYYYCAAKIFTKINDLSLSFLLYLKAANLFTELANIYQSNGDDFNSSVFFYYAAQAYNIINIPYAKRLYLKVVEISLKNHEIELSEKASSCENAIKYEYIDVWIKQAKDLKDIETIEVLAKTCEYFQDYNESLFFYKRINELFEKNKNCNLKTKTISENARKKIEYLTNRKIDKEAQTHASTLPLKTDAKEKISSLLEIGNIHFATKLYLLAAYNYHQASEIAKLANMTDKSKEYIVKTWNALIHYFKQGIVLD